MLIQYLIYFLIQFFDYSPSFSLSRYALSIFWISCSSEIRASALSWLRYPRLAANRSSVSTSQAEPSEYRRKFAKSVALILPHPSAMLIGIDVTARRICDWRPNFSSFGKFCVMRYISLEMFMPRFQISKFRKFRIIDFHQILQYISQSPKAQMAKNLIAQNSKRKLTANG